MGRHKELEEQLFGTIPVTKYQESKHSTKTIVGLTFKNRWIIFKYCMAMAFSMLIGSNPPGQLIAFTKILASMITIIQCALAPSEELVRAEVDKRPYEPFGAPGITDSTKYDGNLAEQYPKDILSDEDKANYRQSITNVKQKIKSMTIQQQKDWFNILSKPDK